MATTSAPSRRTRFLIAVGPHLQASEVRFVDVPARGGVDAHRDCLVDTACGRERQTTSVTRMRDRVRCPECKAAIEQAE